MGRDFGTEEYVSKQGTRRIVLFLLLFVQRKLKGTLENHTFTLNKKHACLNLVEVSMRNRQKTRSIQ